MLEPYKGSLNYPPHNSPKSTIRATEISDEAGLPGAQSGVKILIDKMRKILESEGRVMVNNPKTNPIIPPRAVGPGKNNKNKK